MSEILLYFYFTLFQTKILSMWVVSIFSVIVSLLDMILANCFFLFTSMNRK